MTFPYICTLAGPGNSNPLAICIKFTIHGASENSFTGLKSILEQAISDAIEVPLSTVRSLFVELASPINAIINVTITLMNTTQQMNVLRILKNNPQSFREMINAKLVEHNVHLIMMSQAECIPGQLAYNNS